MSPWRIDLMFNSVETFCAQLGWNLLSWGFCKASHALKSIDNLQTVPIQNHCFDGIVFFLSSHKFSQLLHPHIQQKKKKKKDHWGKYFGVSLRRKKRSYIFSMSCYSSFYDFFSGLASICYSVVSDFRLVERTDPDPQDVVLYTKTKWGKNVCISQFVWWNKLFKFSMCSHVE